MEKYLLPKLICFLKYESETGYKNITEVLRIIDSEEIPEDEKKELILNTFREGGLMEEGFVLEISEEELEDFMSALSEEEVEDMRRQIKEQQDVFHSEMMMLKTLDGNQIVLVPLN